MKRHIYILLFIFACQKELNISRFSNDFSDYESEIRIEAIILPSDSTAIVRIDRSFLISDVKLYDCQDNDFGEISLTECDLYGGTWHGTVDVDLVANCGNWNKYLHDLGSDGISSYDANGDGDFKDFGDVEPDSNSSENNGLPDCGEPHVDNYIEILPNIHVQECDVSISKIKNSQNEICNLEYSFNGGGFFQERFNGSDKQPILEDIEFIHYGAFIPSNDCEKDFWIDYDAQYAFNCNCNIEGFEVITSIEPIMLSHPVVFINKNDSINISECSTFECLRLKSTIFNETKYDTIYFPRFSANSFINYVTILPNIYFQAVQYLHDNNSDSYKLYHGHPDIGYSFNNLINWMKEPIVTDFYDGEGNGIWDEGEIFADENNDGMYSNNEYFFDKGDRIGDVDIYYYEIFTFSESYRNYYFYSELPIDDPIRSNLRNENNKTIMGSFGSLTSEKIIFRIIDCLNFNSLDCQDPSKTHSICEWHENIELSDYDYIGALCLPINWGN